MTGGIGAHLEVPGSPSVPDSLADPGLGRRYRGSADEAPWAHRTQTAKPPTTSNPAATADDRSAPRS